MINPEI